MTKIYNFSAGPACLPQEVLAQAQDELLNYQASGMSVMEMSHRSSTYDLIHNKTIEDLRELLALGDDYEVLLLQGGGSSQFAMVPLNLLSADDVASYVLTGSWAKKAYKEASKFAQVEVLASSEDEDFSYIPEIDPSKMDPSSIYIHLCTNNTIYGSRISPEKISAIQAPLVADMSSNILSEAYDMTQFDLVYAGAQKNLGPAGVTVVIIKKGLEMGKREDLAAMADYQTHIGKNSLYNTPPTYPIYILGLVAKWVKNQGGILAMEEKNKAKASLLYDTIDNSKVFKCKTRPEDRSLMNVVFSTGQDEMDAAFIKGAEKMGLLNLKGHRSTGGIRASIYNAMPLEGVQALVDFIKDFDLENRGR